MSNRNEPEEGELVFCRSIIHHKTGRRIYPKNAKFFVFRAKGRRPGGQNPPSTQLELPLDNEQQNPHQ